MGSPANNPRSGARRLDEVEVIVSITDGKFTAESRSGAKSGSVELDVGETEARLVLNGAGGDMATATLTGPELSNFRTMVDAGLSSLTVDGAGIEQDSRVLAAGYQSLKRVDDGFGTTLDTAALNRLGLVDDAGRLSGGGRQVRCTVLNSGTAILDLLSDSESPFTF